MSTQFKDIPANEWERKHFADELLEDQKADQKSRVKASNLAAAFNALIEVGGLSADIHLPLHIFLDKSRGSAPEEEIVFSEKEAGGLLPGEEGAAETSLRK